MHKRKVFVFGKRKVFEGVFFNAAQFFTTIILLFWCGVYSGSI